MTGIPFIDLGIDIPAAASVTYDQTKISSLFSVTQEIGAYRHWVFGTDHSNYADLITGALITPPTGNIAPVLQPTSVQLFHSLGANGASGYGYGVNGLVTDVDIAQNQTLWVVFKRKPLTSAATDLMGNFPVSGTAYGETIYFNGTSGLAASSSSGAALFASDPQAVALPDASDSPAWASGTLTCSSGGTAGDTVTIDGVTITLVSSGGSALNLNTAASAAALATALMLTINWYIPGVVATAADAVVTVRAKEAGAAGNAIGTTKTGTSMSWGAATLGGGSGTQDWCFMAFSHSGTTRLAGSKDAVTSKAGVLNPGAGNKVTFGGSAITRSGHLELAEAGIVDSALSAAEIQSLGYRRIATIANRIGVSSSLVV